MACSILRGTLLRSDLLLPCQVELISCANVAAFRLIPVPDCRGVPWHCISRVTFAEVILVVVIPKLFHFEVAD